MLKKLVITACSVEEKLVKPLSQPDKCFAVMINPAALNHHCGIGYGDGKRKSKTSEAIGSLGKELKFRNYSTQRLSLELVLDGTGAVDAREEQLDVAEQLKQLKAVCYQYDGTNHEPNVVQLAWGSFIFFGRLTSLTADHTLFKPDGVPLRIKVKLEYNAFMTFGEEAHRKNNSSPDLTHVIEVCAGDTLPLLCERVYRDGRYYAEVARVNGLSHFRALEPGSRLYFPPLS